VIRAGESLARADRLSSYMGQRARRGALRLPEPALQRNRCEHTKLALNRAPAKLELERQRLQLALREAKLASVQQQGKWSRADCRLATSRPTVAW
jgi:hypothetical protein